MVDRFKIGDKVKVPFQAVGIGDGIIIKIAKAYRCGYKKAYLVQVSRYQIWFKADDLELIKDDMEKVIFT